MKTHLVFAVMTVALLAFVISQRHHATLTFDHVIEYARRESLEPYQPPSPMPDALRDLNYDQVRDIRYNEQDSLWRKEGLPFQVRFFYAAGGNTAPISVFQVNRDGSGPVRFSADKFNFGPLVKDLSEADRAKADFSGFRIYYPLNKPTQLDEVAAFQGASYFRPLAKGQIYGLSARGIAIDTLEKEDFPRFTSFWLVEPTADASTVTLYALLDGRDLTGAYEFRIQPGAETKIHVRAVLFPRHRVKDIGYAPLTSMYWYGENTSNTFGNWRPEVHDSDGLQILRSNGEWVWHPLAWATQRQVNVFTDTDAKGFGLFQRDRDFSHYQDLEAKYHMRPSAWVQPDGSWGAGSVVLMQNPAGNEFSDNVVAYWRPKDGVYPGKRVEFAYTLVTFTENAGLPPSGQCVSTRIDYQNEKYYRTVVLDFGGGDLGNQPADQNSLPDDKKVQADVWAGDTGQISDVHVERIPNTGKWQVAFTVSTKQTSQPVEMGCQLKVGGKPITETWSYTWVK
jgi:glucans biosynthesis protein